MGHTRLTLLALLLILGALWTGMARIAASSAEPAGTWTTYHAPHGRTITIWTACITGEDSAAHLRPLKLSAYDHHGEHITYTCARKGY